MINELLPLTRNKMDILKVIYEKGETHLSEISRELKLHPFSAQKTLSKIKPFLNERKAGRTVLLSLDHAAEKYNELACLVEEYRLATGNSETDAIIRHLSNAFRGKNTVICCLFGSHARASAGKDSDIDVLLVVKAKTRDIKKRASGLSLVLGREVNPLILSEKEFSMLIENKEPSIMSLKSPSQRLLIRGACKFMEAMENM